MFVSCGCKVGIVGDFCDGTYRISALDEAAPCTVTFPAMGVGRVVVEMGFELVLELMDLIVEDAIALVLVDFAVETATVLLLDRIVEAVIELLLVDWDIETAATTTLLADDEEVDFAELVDEALVLLLVLEGLVLEDVLVLELVLVLEDALVLVEDFVVEVLGANPGIRCVISEIRLPKNPSGDASRLETGCRFASSAIRLVGSERRAYSTAASG